MLGELSKADPVPVKTRRCLVASVEVEGVNSRGRCPTAVVCVIDRN